MDPGRHSSSQNGRPTIGMLNRVLDYTWAFLRFKGAAEICHDNDVNIICFPGGMIDQPEGLEAQNHIVYDLASAARLDGYLILTSALGVYLDDTEVENLYGRFSPSPLVGFERASGDIPTVFKSDYDSMCLVLSHLVEVHGFRRIGFIPLSSGRNPSCSARYQAYVDTLSKYGIPFDQNLIFSQPSELHDLHERDLKPGEDFNALAATNDELALQALSILENLGIRVPEDLAVVGFDDLSESETISTPLTTAKPPYYEMGQAAAKMLLALLANEEVPVRVSLPSRLRIRQSCGCVSEEVAQAGKSPERIVSVSPMPTWQVSWAAIAGEMAEAAGSGQSSAAFASSLLEGFEAEMNDRKQGAFLSSLNAILYRVGAEGGMVRSWQNALSKMQNRIQPYLGWDASIDTELMFRQARVLIGNVAERMQAYQAMQVEKRSQLFREVSQALVTTFNLKKLMDILADNLPRLGFPSCYISLYETPLPYAYPQNEQGWSHLILAYDEGGRIPLGPEGQRFPTAQLLPEGYWPKRQFCFVVEPLFFQDNQIGFMMLEAKSQDGTLYEALRGQISSALQGAILLNKNEEHLREIDQSKVMLEEANEELKRNQQKLIITEKMASLGRLTAGIAHEINTPLAAIRTSAQALENLVDEYSRSVGNPDVLDEDHLSIVDDMKKSLNVVMQAAEKSAGFIRGIKGQTFNSEKRIHMHFIASPIIEDSLILLEFLIKREKCLLEKEIDEQVTLSGNPRELAQILTNLVTNGVDACMPDGGKITVILKCMDSRSATLSVIDTGRGIPPENITKIYDPLFTTKPFGEGTGLGLTIVHDLVNEFNARIEVKSVPGRTEFAITFPTVQAGQSFPA